jgi:hypothetical protein
MQTWRLPFCRFADERSAGLLDLIYVSRWSLTRAVSVSGITVPESAVLAAHLASAMPLNVGAGVWEARLAFGRVPDLLRKGW